MNVMIEATSDTGPAPRRRIRWATVALVIVRLWIAALVVAIGFDLIGMTDRSLGDRLSFEEYGFSAPTPDGGVEEHDGPWLVLTVDATRRFCSSLNRPYDESNPDDATGEIEGACRISKAVRSEFGDVDVDGLRLVRQVEGPPPRVEHQLMLVLLTKYAFFLLVAIALERILSLTSRGRPFSTPAVRWLRVLAAGVAGALLVVPFITDRFIDGLVREYFPESIATIGGAGSSIDLGGIFAVILILVIAAVWRTGIKLQDDVEATV